MVRSVKPKEIDLQRYHFRFEAGSIGAENYPHRASEGEAFMDQDPNGSYVMFSDLKVLNEQITHLHAIIVADRERIALRDAEYNRLRAEPGVVNIRDTRVNQLINELYHDRARLEKIIQRACLLAEEVCLASADMHDKHLSELQNSQEIVDFTIRLAQLKEFGESNAV
jgi:hypothetical protein